MSGIEAFAVGSSPGQFGLDFELSQLSQQSPEVPVPVPGSRRPGLMTPLGRSSMAAQVGADCLHENSEKCIASIVRNLNRNSAHSVQCEGSHRLPNHQEKETFCDNFFNNFNSVFDVSALYKKREYICSAMKDISVRSQELVDILKKNGAIYVPARSWHKGSARELLPGGMPMGVVYRMSKTKELIVDFQAGGLFDGDTSFVEETMRSGSYKKPHKVFSYNPLTKNFVTGVAYSGQKTEESILANRAYPDYFDPQVRMSWPYDDINYSYAKYLGKDLHTAIVDKFFNLEEKRIFFNAIKKSVYLLHSDEKIFHNDLSFGNIVVLSKTSAAIIDYGLAVSHDSAALQATDLVQGTYRISVAEHCNLYKSTFLHACDALRKSECIDIHALGEMAKILDVSPGEDLSKKIDTCSAWVKKLFSHDPQESGRALKAIPVVHVE